MANQDINSVNFIWDDKEKLIKATIIGAPTHGDTDKAIEKGIKIIKGLREKGEKKILILGDGTKAKVTTDRRVRKSFVNYMKTGDFDKIAIFIEKSSTGNAIKMVVQFLITFSNTKKVQIFNDKDEALKWLRK